MAIEERAVGTAQVGQKPALVSPRYTCVLVRHGRKGQLDALTPSAANHDSALA